MPKSNAVTLYDDRGYALLAGGTTAIAAAVGTTVVKGAPGRLVKVIITTAGTATDNITIYDNASAGSGTVLGVIAGGGTVGTSISFDMPALNGITAVNVASGPAVVIGFS
jgi:uncharacterized protein (UPF0333 family)